MDPDLWPPRVLLGSAKNIDTDHSLHLLSPMGEDDQHLLGCHLKTSTEFRNELNQEVMTWIAASLENDLAAGCSFRL